MICCYLLGLVHTSDRIRSGVGIGSTRNVTIQCKIKKRNHKRSRKPVGIGVRRIIRVSFSSDSASASVAFVVPIHTRSELSSDSDSASVASVNQPLQVKKKPFKPRPQKNFKSRPQNRVSLFLRGFDEHSHYFYIGSLRGQAAG